MDKMTALSLRVDAAVAKADAAAFGNTNAAQADADDRWYVKLEAERGGGKKVVSISARTADEALDRAMDTNSGWVAVSAKKMTRFDETQMDASTSTDVKIVYNKLLGGWYVVRGPHQTPLGGRHDSREAAQAWLAKQEQARGDAERQFEVTMDDGHGNQRVLTIAATDEREARYAAKHRNKNDKIVAVKQKRADGELSDLRGDDDKTKISPGAMREKLRGLSYEKLHAALKDGNVDAGIKKLVEKELDERAGSGRRERGDSDAGRTTRMYPSYTTDELKGWLKERDLAPDVREKVTREIANRDSGASQHKVTPQIEGGKPSPKVGRM